MNKFNYNLFCSVFVGFILLNFSCTQKEIYTETPQILNSSIYKYRQVPTTYGRGILDSVIIRIQVKSVEDDLGMDEPILSNDAKHFLDNGNWTNYRIKTLRLEGDKFVASQSSDIRDVVFFPKLTNNKLNKSIEGYLYFNRIFIYSRSSIMYPTKFQIQIRDNSLIESNVVETDTVIVPYIN